MVAWERLFWNSVSGGLIVFLWFLAVLIAFCHSWTDRERLGHSMNQHEPLVRSCATWKRVPRSSLEV
jgi:hypothetical protein